MDLNLLRKLVRLMERGELAELEISDEKEGLTIHLRRSEEPATLPPTVHVVGGGQMATSHMPAPQHMQAAAGAPAEAPGGLPPGTEEFHSPMVGTFYRASGPDSAAFVEVGSRVTAESVLCIVEAMKVMNEIKAEMSGEIVEILVENGEPIEFGQPLFLIKKG